VINIMSSIVVKMHGVNFISYIL